MEYLLKGGTVVSSTSHVEKKDIWIKDGRICQIASEIRQKPNTTIIDVEAYGIIPGLIYEYPLWKVIRQKKRYELGLKDLLQRGYTTFVDTISWNSNYSLYDLDEYTKALHVNTPMDFSFQLLLPIQQFTMETISFAIKCDIRQLILSIQDPYQLLKIRWNNVYPMIERKGLFIWIYPHVMFPESAKGKNEIEEIHNCWYYVIEHFGLNVLRKDAIKQQMLPNPSEHSYDIVNAQSIIAAKRAGIFPQKGVIAQGSDADLVLVPLHTLREKRAIEAHTIFLRGKPISFPFDPLPFGEGRKLVTRSSRSFIY